MLRTLLHAAVGAAFLGLLQIPGVTHVMVSWLEPIAPDGMIEPTAGQEWLLTLLGTAVGVAGIAIAAHLYRGSRDAVDGIRLGRGRLLEQALSRRLYWDDLYAFLFERPAQWAATALNRGVDAPAFRWGPLDGVGTFTAFLGRTFNVVENGIVRSYALVFALGVGGLLLFLLVRGV